MSGIRRPTKATNTVKIEYWNKKTTKIDIAINIQFPNTKEQKNSVSFYFDDILVYTFIPTGDSPITDHIPSIMNNLMSLKVDLRFGLSLVDTKVRLGGSIYVVRLWQPDTGLVQIIPIEQKDDPEPDITAIDVLSKSLIWVV